MPSEDLLNVAPLRRALIRRVARTAVVLLAMLLLFIAGVARLLQVEEKATLTSLSPDDAYRVRIVERKGRSRAFHLRLQRLKPEGEPETLAAWSGDEGRPAGSERVVWSVDGGRVLLLGRHFSVVDAARLPNGEQMYLLYDLASRILGDNAKERKGPGFTLADVRRVKWFGWAPPSADAPPARPTPPPSRPPRSRPTEPAAP